MSALAGELPRVNGWSIAWQAGDRTPDRTQRLLNHAVWDTLAAMSVVRRFAVAGLEQAARRRRRAGLTVGAVDETGQEKAGSATAGAKRQYMGCAGRVANGINTALPGGTKLTCAEAARQLARDTRRWEVRSAGKGQR